MLRLPIKLSEWLFRLPGLTRPHLLSLTVPEAPGQDVLGKPLVFVEVRDGFQKWAHLSCPRCGDHIQLQLAGKDRWKLQTDWLSRPTIYPSIWERSSCGAHFFVTRGDLRWVD